MGSLTDLLGTSPRVAILEAFAEHPELEFSVPEIVRQTGVSKRGVYLHVAKLLEEGVIAKSGKLGKCQYYKVNEHDRRGEFLGILESAFTLGKIEREVKRDYGIRPEEPLVVQVRPELAQFEYVALPDAASTGKFRYQDTWRFYSSIKHHVLSAYLKAYLSSGTTATAIEVPVQPTRVVENEGFEDQHRKLLFVAR
jgi:DNA-binding transcriptional ArsR family regulator